MFEKHFKWIEPLRAKYDALGRWLTAFVGDGISRHPWVSVGLGLALFALFAAGIPRIHADFTHRGFFWPDDPELVKFDSFEHRFGNDDVAVIAIHSKRGVFTPETAKVVQQITARVWKIPEIIRVDSLANYPWVHADGDDIKVEPLMPDTLPDSELPARQKAALANEVVPGYLVSRDSQTALIFARIKPGLDRPSDSPLIYHSMEKLADEFKSPDISIYVSGSPAVIASFAEIASKDGARVFGLALVVAIVSLAYLLRTVAGVLLPIVNIVLCILAVYGFAGWTGIVLNNIAASIPSVMLAACIGDSVHIIVAFIEHRREGLDREAAIRKALSENLLPTFLTSFTTSLGFLSFVSVAVRPIEGLGYLVAFGAMFAWIETYLIVGGMLRVLPSKVKPAPKVEDSRGARGLAGRYLTALVKQRAWVVAAAIAVSIGCTWVSLSLQVNSDPFKYFAPNVPVRAANEYIESAVGGARGIEVIVDAGREDGVKDPGFLRKVDQLQQWIESQPQVTRAISVIDALKATHRALNGDKPEFYRIPDDKATVAQELFLYTLNLPQGMDLNDRVTIRNDALRVSVLWKIPTSREVIEMADEIVAHAKQLGLDADVTGKYYVFDSMNRYVAITFLWSFATASFTIALIMLIMFRSIKLTLISMIPNILPVLFGGAVLKMMNQPLDLGTVMVASVCLGIAVDDTIHIMVGWQRDVAGGMTPMEAMREVMAHHTRPIIVTTIVLSLSFCAFLVADFTPNLYFGVLTGIVLAFAMFWDLTLTPVLLTWQRGKSAGATAVDMRDEVQPMQA